MNRGVWFVAIALGVFAATGAVRAYGDVARSPLERGRSIEREMAGAETHHYSVALQAGDFFRVAAEQRGVDIVLLVIAPDGTKLAEVDSPNGTNGPESAELVAPASGTYQVDIRALDSKAPPGRYSINLERRLSSVEHAAEIAAENAAQEAVSRWVASNAISIRSAEPGQGFHDMRRVAHLVGSARVVALGEATHGSREFFRFKHRMLEFLATQVGFTVFAIEATMPEAFDVNEYVLTGKGDARKALSALYFWTWNTEEVLEMIEWMRRYNADPAHVRKLKFYGFDMQSPTRALKVTFAYLRKVDPESLVPAQTALAPLLDPFTAAETEAMAGEWKDSAAATISALIRRFDERRAVYVERSSVAEYDLARQHARVAAQNIESFTGPNRGLVRDRAMAENIEWILTQEAPGTKAVVWAHNYHVANRPGTMGEQLRRRFGAGLVTFGFVFSGGAFQAVQSGIRLGGLREFVLPPAPAGTLDGVLARSGLPLGIIDLRALPEKGQVADWLRRSLPTRNIGSMYTEAGAVHFWENQNVTSYYDAVVFFQKTTAARPNHSGMRAPPVFLAAPVNLDFEEGSPGLPPPGWHTSPSLADFDFAVKTFEEDVKRGKRSATIRRKSGRHYGETVGALSQRLDGIPYRGKRIRLRASVRSDGGGASQAYLWLLAQQGPFDPSSHASGSQDPITSRDWRDYERIVDVPSNAQYIEYGLAMTGDGQVWLDSMSVDVVEPH